MSTFVIPHKPTGKTSSLPVIDEWKGVIQATRTKLLKVIEQALTSKNKNMMCMFEGTYRDDCRIPTLEYWEQCNPAIAQGVNEMCTELREKGWTPHISIGLSTYNKYMGYYGGGDKLYVTCDFTS